MLIVSVVINFHLAAYYSLTIRSRPCLLPAQYKHTAKPVKLLLLPDLNRLEALLVHQLE